MTALFIGTAGWTVPATAAAHFPAEGTALQRYATHFRCAEINSSFHRSHRSSTWERWAASVPDGFRFSAKMSKAVTHKLKLQDSAEPVADWLREVEPLGELLAVLLVQLPPSLAFEDGLAETFFGGLRARWQRAIVCEPRHPSWFERGPDALLARQRVARVAADPARVPAAAEPGGWRGLSYWRLHGSPVPYRSSYDNGRLEAYADRIRAERGEGREVWCIFDNTASSAAAGDALKLNRLLEG